MYYRKNLFSAELPKPYMWYILIDNTVSIKRTFPQKYGKAEKAES
jgi:hypothetical protein